MNKFLLVSSSLLLSAAALTSESKAQVAYAYYDPVCLMETVTSNTDMSAIKTYAFVDYFSSTYTGGEQGKVFGVVVHIDDPMAITTSYADRIGGVDAALFSRKYNGNSQSKNTVNLLLADAATSRINIDKATLEDGKVKVNYSLRQSFEADDLNMRTLFIVTEDGVKGDDEAYNQNNSFYTGFPQTNLVRIYGSALWGYFKKYCEADAVIPAENMTYNKVARGIYPNFYGSEIHSEYELDLDKEFEYEFALPDNIQNVENIKITAVALNNKNYEMLYADQVAYDQFGVDLSKHESAVKTINADVTTTSATLSGDDLCVRTALAGQVEVFNASGMKVAAADIIPGDNTISLNGINGVLIVKININGSVRTAKFVK